MHKVWKGPHEARIAIVVEDSTCWTSFEVGETTHVFAHGTGPEYRTSVCDYVGAELDLDKQLGPPTVLSEPGRPLALPDPGRVLLTILLALFGLG